MWAGSKAVHPKGERAHWLLGAEGQGYGLWDGFSLRRSTKICLSDQTCRAESSIDLRPICLRTSPSHGLLGILKEEDRVRCLPSGHLSLTEQGKGHGKKRCQ